MRTPRWSLRWPAWGRKKDPPAEAAPHPLPAPAPPLRRAATTRPDLRHEWLDVTVARARLEGPVPLAQARVVLRPWPVGQARPGEPIARGATGPDGTVAFHLPLGRYALAARHGDETKAVTLHVAHAGRAHVLLDGPSRLATLAVQVVGPDGTPAAGIPVEARDAQGHPVARALADEAGHALLPLLPATYEVRAADAVQSVRVERDDRLRLTLPTPAPARDARQATAGGAAPFEPSLDTDGNRGFRPLQPHPGLDGPWN